MQKTDVAGLKIDAINKQDLLVTTLSRIKANQKTWITTVYSEFLYASLRNPKIMEMLNRADFAVPDGIGIFWAKRYLEIPLTFSSPPFSKGGRGGVKYWLVILQAAWQLLYTLAAIIFKRQWILKALPEKIVGAGLIWDIAEMAAKNNLSVYFLGGHGDTPKTVAMALHAKHHNLKIAGFSEKDPGNEFSVAEINRLNADILLVAYGPIKQEKWIAKNLPHLNVKLVMGVGGSFDYIAGKKLSPPKFIRYSGFEWLWRLLTQPYRFYRILNATFGLMNKLWRFKVFESLSLRKNVVSIVLNEQNLILVGKRNKDNKNDRLYGYEKKDVINYWQFPQGGMDAEENFEQAAKRELGEELSLTDVKFLFVSKKTNVYNWQNSNRPFFGQRSKFRGQEQHLVYFKYQGPESEIKIDNVEFEKYKWINSEELLTVLHPERKNLGKIVLEDLKNLA